ncbi:MAG: class I SAM-dependent methyltransferase [Sedimentisphaerales bacterium]|nr:class I SAM-dependent methyltransferase [Sedimentisphaerales bacterium]
MDSKNNSFEKRCSKAHCRSCNRKGLIGMLNLGMMPLSDGLLTETQLTAPEDKFPLEVAYCPNCSLVQILETVPPEKLFCQDYPYYSSFSNALLEHSHRNVLALIRKCKLDANSLVVELASNDGYLLKNYMENGIPCLGIDPAKGPAKAAEKIGVPTICEFFTKQFAQKLANDGRRADIIHANNVLAHVEDTNGFVQGIRILLKDDGVAVIEVPYVKDLIDNCQFDTIYHEHLCYFSVTALDYLFRQNDLYLNDIERLSIHGGSLRLYVARTKNVQEAVRILLQQEKQLSVDKFQYYEGFGDKVQNIGKKMRTLLQGKKQIGKTIAAYGAAAKGAIMLNFIGIGTDVIDYVVDRNIHKQGKYMPGLHIPIFDPSRLEKELPDYVIILPWNFKDEILNQEAGFRNKGGKFVIPIPEPVIV